jgi:coenzyme F420-reducing hydrogenase delta subunit
LLAHVANAERWVVEAALTAAWKDSPALAHLKVVSPEACFQCSPGMVHPNLVIEALTKGADGVLMLGCHPGDCHYLEGNLRARARADAINLMLEDFGLEPERFRLEWVSASEGPRFAQVVTEMVEQVRKLSPSPYRT